MSLNAGHSPSEAPRTRDEILSSLDDDARPLFQAALGSHRITEQELLDMTGRCIARISPDNPMHILLLVELQEILGEVAVARYVASEQKQDDLQKLFELAGEVPERNSSSNFPEIAGFRFLKKLGQGGQGTVYLAEQDQGILKRKVAVKIFKDSTGQHFSRMKREVNAPASLPSSITGKIVITYDAQPLPDGSGYFSVMEYVEGGESLGEVEKGIRPPLDVEQVWDIAQNILETLQAFEEQGVAHRDIKPANILVAGSTVKLADFGLVKTQGHEESFATEEGTILGTMAYLDPDNAKDARFDVYSLGMTVRCLLTGSLPFSGEGKNVSHLLNAHRSFSHKMEEYSASRKNGGGWSRSTTSSSPEWVPQLKEPRTPCEKALAYLTERASLPIVKRPMPSALLAELSERFPDLMGDVKSRKRVDSIRQHSRTRMRNITAGIAVTAAAAGAIAVGVMSMGRGGSEGKTSGKGGVVNVDPPVKQEKIEASPPKPEKKFEEMTEGEKQKFVDEISKIAPGIPELIQKEDGTYEKVMFRLCGLKSNDKEKEVVLGDPRNSVIKEIKSKDGGTIIVGMSVMDQNPEDLAEVLAPFKKAGVPILQEDYHKPTDRYVYFIRKGDKIMATLLQTFVGYRLDGGGENIAALYPWRKDKAGELPGGTLPFRNFLAGEILSPALIASSDFPDVKPIGDYRGMDHNGNVKALWISLGGTVQ